MWNAFQLLLERIPSECSRKFCFKMNFPRLALLWEIIEEKQICAADVLLSITIFVKTICKGSLSKARAEDFGARACSRLTLLSFLGFHSFYRCRTDAGYISQRWTPFGNNNPHDWWHTNWNFARLYRYVTYFNHNRDSILRIARRKESCRRQKKSNCNCASKTSSLVTLNMFSIFTKLLSITPRKCIINL